MATKRSQKDRSEPAPQRREAANACRAVGEFIADTRQFAANEAIRIDRTSPPDSLAKRKRPTLALKLDVATQEIARLKDELAHAQQDLSRYKNGPPEQANPITIQFVCELANCLWYVKARHLHRKWDDDSTDDPDPQTRGTLGRLARAISVLKRNQIEIIDKTGDRYPPGSEGFMRPVDLIPTSGITFDIIQQTMRPAVSIGGTIVQPGEVFVSVPAAAPDRAETAQAADNSGAGETGPESDLPDPTSPSHSTNETHGPE